MSQDLEEQLKALSDRYFPEIKFETADYCYTSPGFSDAAFLSLFFPNVMIEEYRRLKPESHIYEILFIKEMSILSKLRSRLYDWPQSNNVPEVLDYLGENNYEVTFQKMTFPKDMTRVTITETFENPMN